MLDNKINSQDFVNFCNETLDISGKIALAHFRDIRDLTIKVDESPVTPVSYTHLRAHETRHDLVCRLLLEKKKN